MNFKNKTYSTLWVENKKIKIIDQTKLPFNFLIKELKTLSQFCSAIKNMEVRGAPLIGVTAAFGLALSIKKDPSISNIKKSCKALLKTRPTAINLRWALNYIEKRNRPLKDPAVQETIGAQLKFQNKIKNNASIVKDISMGGFDELKMEKFSKDNNLELKDYQISNLKQNEIFSEGMIKRIFLTKEGEVDLITDSTLIKNFLFLTVKTQFKKLEKNSNVFEKYEAKARLNLTNIIYRTFDEELNRKYKVELNQKTIDRVKNSF